MIRPSRPTPPIPALHPVAPAHAEVLAALHRICFADPWNAEAMREILAMPGATGRLALAGDRLVAGPGPSGPAGLVLWRIAADEAEILTIAVLPPWRRQGLGRRLVEIAAAEAAQAGATVLFLEVATTNAGGRALYAAAGFNPVGRRRGYYNGADALVLRRDLG